MLVAVARPLLLDLEVQEVVREFGAPSMMNRNVRSDGKPTARGHLPSTASPLRDRKPLRVSIEALAVVLAVDVPAPIDISSEADAQAEDARPFGRVDVKKCAIALAEILESLAEPTSQTDGDVSV